MDNDGHAAAAVLKFVRRSPRHDVSVYGSAHGQGGDAPEQFCGREGRKSRATATNLALTRRRSKNCRHDFPDAEPDLRSRAFLYHDGAGHSGADQHAGGHVRDLDADRNALCQSDPGECGIDRREEFWTILVILVRDAP